MDTTRPGPAAMAAYDQDREVAIQALRDATHGFVVSTAYLDEEGDPSYCYYAGVNPNDRNQMTLGWASEWYRAIHDRTYNLFASVIRQGIEARARFENDDEGEQ